MTCPSCNQTASSFLRSAFSLQGVSFSKSIQGYFKCQNCATLLRVTSFGKLFWLFFVSTAIVLALFVLLVPRILSIFGAGATEVIWIILVFFTVFVLQFGTWKFGHAERVDTDTTSTTNAST